ncbi:MAG: hypothetical protein M1450_05405, partial [Patescibacteria group bacterium]|nr:hypothetical protein [Patescibacteria group bacterium]
LGFKPKGFWLPETAVSKKTLAVLARKGIEFVVLRDNQLRFRGENRPNPVYVGLGEENLNGFPRRIAVIHVDSNISGSVSFDQDATSNVESFFARHGHKSIAYATDTEFYGEHLPFKDMFLDALLNPTTMETFGFSYFDIESKLKQLEEDPQYAEVNDFSSWSCEGYHKLGRWRGDPVCNCDGCIPEFWRENIVGKRQIFLTIRSYQAEIERLLSSKDPLWRDKFVDVSLATRKSMYARGEIEDDIRKLSERTGFENLRDEEIKKLNYALISLWDAKTTCGTFFAKDRRDTERPERAFAYLNFAQIESLIPGIDRLKPPIEYIQACIDQRQRMLAA